MHPLQVIEALRVQAMRTRRIDFRRVPVVTFMKLIEALRLEFRPCVPGASTYAESRSSHSWNYSIRSGHAYQAHRLSPSPGRHIHEANRSPSSSGHAYQAHRLTPSPGRHIPETIRFAQAMRTRRIDLRRVPVVTFLKLIDGRWAIGDRRVPLDCSISCSR
jgi:hypothetical protein